MIEDVIVEVRSAEDENDIVTLHQKEVRAHFTPSEAPRRLTLIDPGMHVPKIIDIVSRDANFNDHIEGVDPKILDTKAIEQLSYVVGRAYDLVEVYEIEGIGPNGSVLPYFIVSSNDAKYDISAMGYGEIASLYVLWSILRATPGTLFLIEEPEAFLSPRSQAALVDVFASYVRERQLTFIVTSHSGAIATRLRYEEIIYTTRSSSRVALHCPARRVDLVSRLGLIPQRPFLIFVEDPVAAIFADALVSNYSTHLAGAVEFAVCNGESEVVGALRLIPHTVRSVVHVGLLDGDQRANGPHELRICYLPGDVPPEKLLHDFLRSHSVRAGASILEVEEDIYVRAAAHADGMNIHDWVHELSKTLNIHFGEILRRIALSWSKTNMEHTREFIACIERLLH
ncbi:MAG: AAA family ATPase [Dokdonella sp.]